ncbi:hypothetical protein NIA69_22750 [Gemmiger formicilis]|nr:hypothetical protein [Gemmiger formicilis]
MKAVVREKFQMRRMLSIILPTGPRRRSLPVAALTTPTRSTLTSLPISPTKSWMMPSSN